MVRALQVARQFDQLADATLMAAIVQTLFAVTITSDEPTEQVLQGLLKPNQCPAFGKSCTPRTPLGATMVSSEGACAAYYQFRRLETAAGV